MAGDKILQELNEGYLKSIFMKGDKNTVFGIYINIVTE